MGLRGMCCGDMMGKKQVTHTCGHSYAYTNSGLCN